MRYTLLSLLILFSSYAVGQNDQAKSPVIAVKVPLNKSVVLNGISIKFIDVLEDSRCPTGVNCIWAGRAIVKVEVMANNKKEDKTLIFGKTKHGESENLNLYSSDSFTISGLTLNPYPHVENSNEETDYVLLIQEKKL